jgi:hypothetical protein
MDESNGDQRRQRSDEQVTERHDGKDGRRRHQQRHASNQV